MTQYAEMYSTRRLVEGYPELEEAAHTAFSGMVAARPDDTARIQRLITYIDRLVDLRGSRNILVLGCGPSPQVAQILKDMGHTVTCVEPVTSFVESARSFLGSHTAVLGGSAEAIPLLDSSQDIVVFESVLEHVDSIPKSLEEIFRVLVPGGVLYLNTTNRHHLSMRGVNGEFNVPFYNWFPRLVKESYVFQHLHFDPRLANFTRRPAVHWLTFSDLCCRGRDAGFAQFYSIVDLVRATDLTIARSRFRRAILPVIQRNPWIRSVALTQVGDTIFMYKRRCDW